MEQDEWTNIHSSGFRIRNLPRYIMSAQRSINRMAWRLSGGQFDAAEGGPWLVFVP